MKDPRYQAFYSWFQLAPNETQWLSKYSVHCAAVSHRAASSIRSYDTSIMLQKRKYLFLVQVVCESSAFLLCERLCNQSHFKDTETNIKFVDLVISSASIFYSATLLECAQYLPSMTEDTSLWHVLLIPLRGLPQIFHGGVAYLGYRVMQPQAAYTTNELCQPVRSATYGK